MRRALRKISKNTRKVLASHPKKLADFLKPRVSRLGILDVGCGVGSLLLELAKAGAINSLGVDASKYYISAAKMLKDRARISNSIDFRIIDFVEKENEIEKKDIVISDKVICCYPDYESFLKTTTSHAHSLYGIIYPRRNVISRFIVRIVNFFIQFTKKKGFQFHLHPVKKMNSLIENQGFKRVFKENTIIWEIAVFEKVQ